MEGRSVVSQPGLVTFADTFRYVRDTVGWTGFTHYESPMLEEHLFAPGDTLVVLDFDDEGDVGGAWRVWLSGSLFGVWAFWDSSDSTSSARLVRPALQDIWAKVRERQGRTGWVQANDERLRGTDYYNREMDCSLPR